MHRVMASQLTKLAQEDSNIMASSSRNLYYLPFSILVVSGELTSHLFCLGVKLGFSLVDTQTLTITAFPC